MTRPRATDSSLAAVASRTLERLIARALPHLMHRALQRGLHAVYARGNWTALPSHSVIFAMNHHAWWDGYLAWLVHYTLRRPAHLMMSSEGLERYPYFRHLGVISTREVRTAIRGLQHGQDFYVFPEGKLQSAGPMTHVSNGLTFIAYHAQVPVYPLAIRVTLRGAQHPEAFLSLGEALEPVNDAVQMQACLTGSMNSLLEEIDRCLLTTDPEAPPPGFDLWLRGARSAHERAMLARRFLGRPGE